jgi:hypothetical protein
MARYRTSPLSTCSMRWHAQKKENCNEERRQIYGAAPFPP